MQQMKLKVPKSYILNLCVQTCSQFEFTTSNRYKLKMSNCSYLGAKSTSDPSSLSSLSPLSAPEEKGHTKWSIKFTTLLYPPVFPAGFFLPPLPSRTAWFWSPELKSMFSSMTTSRSVSRTKWLMLSKPGSGRSALDLRAAAAILQWNQT